MALIRSAFCRTSTTSDVLAGIDWDGPLDILVNNAGGFVPTLRRTSACSRGRRCWSSRPSRRCGCWRPSTSWATSPQAQEASAAEGTPLDKAA
jgi:hypothetical protein